MYIVKTELGYYAGHYKWAQQIKDCVIVNEECLKLIRFIYGVLKIEVIPVTQIEL